MTDRLYYDDPYLREFDATVTAVEWRDNRAMVALDRDPARAHIRYLIAPWVVLHNERIRRAHALQMLEEFDLVDVADDAALVRARRRVVHDVRTSSLACRGDQVAPVVGLLGSVEET